MVPHDALQLEKALQSFFVDSELFVAEPEVVQGFNTGGVVVQGNHVKLLKNGFRILAFVVRLHLGLLQVALLEVAVAEVDKGGGIVTIALSGDLSVLLRTLDLTL